MALEHEMAVYQAHLLELLAHEGKFVAIRGDTIVGPFEDYEAALEGGYGEFGPVPFLVKQIARAEPIHYFARDLPLCQG